MDGEPRMTDRERVAWEAYSRIAESDPEERGEYMDQETFLGGFRQLTTEEQDNVIATLDDPFVRAILKGITSEETDGDGLWGFGA